VSVTNTLYAEEIPRIPEREFLGYSLEQKEEIGNGKAERLAIGRDYSELADDAHKRGMGAGIISELSQWKSIERRKCPQGKNSVLYPLSEENFEEFIKLYKSKYPNG
jgi:hypothetical protein